MKPVASIIPYVHMARNLWKNRFIANRKVNKKSNYSNGWGGMNIKAANFFIYLQ